MALTNSTTFDVAAQTQSMTFDNPGMVDQISYASGVITYSAISSYNLSKSDLLLYLKYINTFNNLLIVNFPTISTTLNSIWPLCSFNITENSLGVTHLTYTQTSTGTQVQSINYVPSAVAASISARSSPVTISLQEFAMSVLMYYQYAIQVGLN